MASPPSYTQSPTALSPPHSSTTTTQPPLTAAALRNNASAAIGSKRRPSIATGDGTAPSGHKRRKASTMSVTSMPAGSAHPLRQTSFPPEDGMAGGPRSPSAYSDNMSIVSGSQVSAVGSAAGGGGPPFKKKRGRKSKADKAREAEIAKTGGSSVAPGSTAGGGSGGGADSKNAAGTGAKGDEHAEEDDDNEDNVHMSITTARRSEEQTQEEKRLRAMLTRCMDADQFDRYSNWRAAKLPDPIVRRVSDGWGSVLG